MDVVDGFDLQEIRFLGHRAGFCIGNSRSHSASFGLALSAAILSEAPAGAQSKDVSGSRRVGLLRFYDKGCLIANEKWTNSSQT
jgi:hypothetical protein